MDPVVKDFINILGNLIINTVAEGILWYRYVEKDSPESCEICNIILKTGDKCRPLDCTHKFHAECIVRYSERVENNCPICKVKIKDLLLTSEELQKM